MKFQRSERFDSDWGSLKREHRDLFRECFPAFSEACDSHAQTAGFRWPARFRARPMTGYPGIWEMTWSFASPDGRATFEFVRTDDGETLVRWRRIGTHDVYKQP